MDSACWSLSATVQHTFHSYLDQNGKSNDKIASILLHERLRLLHDHLLGHRDHALVLLGNVHLELDQLVRKQRDLELVALCLFQRARSVLQENNSTHPYEHFLCEELSKVNVILLRHFHIRTRLKAIDRRGEVGRNGKDRLERFPDFFLRRSVHFADQQLLWDHILSDIVHLLLRRPDGSTRGD